MSSVFISYSSQDNEFTRKLVERLKQQLQECKIFIGIEHGISKIDQIKNIICILSESYLLKETCRKEFKYALLMKKNVIPILIERIDLTAKEMTILDMICIPLYLKENSFDNEHWDVLLTRIKSDRIENVIVRFSLNNQCDKKQKVFQHVGSISCVNFSWLHWMFLLNETTLVLTDHSKLHLFQIQDEVKYIKSVVVKDNADLKGICKLKSGNICVVDNENRSVYLLNASDLHIIKEMQLSGRKKRWLYACEEDARSESVFIADRDRKSIIVLRSADLQLRDEVLIQLPACFSKRISLRDVRIHNESVYLTDNNYGNQCIHVFSLNFEYIRTFGLGFVWNPNSIMFNKNGEILVLDRLFDNKHKIHVFNKKEQFERFEVLDNCHECTNGLFLDDSCSLLAIGNYEIDYCEVDLLNEYVEKNGWPNGTTGCTIGIEHLVGKKEKRSARETSNIQLYKCN